MPMHPALEQHALLGVLELLFGADPEAVLAGLRGAGFVDAGSLPRWQAELALGRSTGAAVTIWWPRPS